MFPPEVVGGAEIIAHRQALALRARGAEVAVMAGGLPRPDFPRGAWVRETVDGLAVHRLSIRSMEPDANFHSPAAAERLRALVSEWRPDVAHFHNLTGLGVNLIPTAKQCGVRTVVTLHDHWGFCFKNTRLRNDGSLCEAFDECAACLPSIVAPEGGALPMRLRRDYVAWRLTQADLLISPSEYLAQTYAMAGFPRPVVLSNGAPCDSIPAPARHAGAKVEFAAVGYLGEHKGVPVLLRAAERLARDPELAGRWTLTIAGHGHLEAKVRAAVADDRFGGAVRFAGRLAHEDALALIAGAHVVVVASSWPENQSVTLLEALASGAAQIASRIGGNPELVREGETGFLFAPDDDEALAGAMRRLIVEPELALSFGRRNALRRLEFDEGRTIDRLWALLSDAGAVTRADEGVVVLCAGRDWSADVASMVDHLHLAEAEGDPRIRLIWRDWIGPRHWEGAKLLWVSGEAGKRDAPVVSQALEGGLPILAQAGSACASAGQAAVTYDNLLEAAGWIAAAAASAQDRPQEARRRRDLLCARAALVGARLAQATRVTAEAGPIARAVLGPGVELRVGAGLERALADGWEPVEDWGVWSSEPRAWLGFTLRDGQAARLRLVLRLCALIPKGGNRRIRLFSGKRLLRQVTLRRPQMHVSVRIGPRDMTAEGAFELGIDADLVRPSDVSDSMDRRALGIGLRAIKIRRSLIARIAGRSA